MLSKHLAQILSPMMGDTDFTIKNSVEFFEQMKNVSLKEDEELVSFDVVSFFTSIPVKLAIQVAKDLLSNDDTLQDRTTIPVDDVVDLMNFCFRQQMLSTTTITSNRSSVPPWALQCQLLWQTWSWKTLNSEHYPPPFPNRVFGNDM